MQSSRDRWFTRLHAERERRRDAALMIDGRNPREVFIERLARIGERLAAAPDYVEPDEQERKELAREVTAWFKERFPNYRWR
jgi:hypothetical protein